MAPLGLMARLLRMAAATLAVAPLAALVGSALLDRGPEGQARYTAFPAALVVFDPYTWDCARNSLIVALLVTAVSVLVGLPVGRTLMRWRFWGRPPLSALVALPLLLSPAAAAVGLSQLAGPGGLSPLSAADFAWSQPWNWRIGGAWLAWVGIALAGGIPVVALALVEALGRTELAWEDAGLAAGATSRQVWRTLIWPLVRPRVARAAGLVFAWTLLDPSIPLLFGLRRSLAFQVVDSFQAASASGAGHAHAAALGLLGLGLVVAFRFVLLTFGGRVHGGLPSGPRPGQATARRASWRRTAFTIVGLGALGLALIAPWLALPLVLPGPAGMNRELARPDLPHALAVSAWVGATAATLALALAWGVSRAGLAAGEREWTFMSLPPLVIGLGVALVPAAVRGAADMLATRSPGIPMGAALGLPGWLDPAASPAVGLVLALAIVRVPLLARAITLTRARYREVWIEAAQVLGASHVRAWADFVRPRIVAPLAASWLVAALTAGLDVPVAVLLATTDRLQPVGPMLLALSSQPGGSRAAVALAAAATAAGVLVFALTALTLARLVSTRESA